MSKRKKGASGKLIISARKRAKRGAVDHAEGNTAITSTTENPISQRAANFLRDEAVDSRLRSLRYIALELLDAVESLRIPRDDRSENQINWRDEVHVS